MQSWLKLAKRILPPAIILTVVFGTAFYGGYQIGIASPRTIVLENITNTDADKKTVDFGIFWEAWDLLKREHLKGAQAEDQEFLYGAIRGLTNSLKDPNTIFLPPEDSKKFEEDVNGRFGGIGAEIGIRNNQLVIIAPLKNTPAERAGLKAGDKILAIDGKGTEGLEVSEAVQKIRGEEGTDVVLTILRENWDAAKDIKITRAKIEIPTIESKILDQEALTLGNKEIAHISLFAFNQNAPLAFYKEVLKVLLGRADGIVLDLRNNPGGFLEVAANLSGWFLDKGAVIVTEKFRDGREIVFRANGNGALKNIPTAILVNKGSASASEILAGALRAQLGIKLIGEKTFGKGTVQELRELSDGSKIKLTIANWVLPDGAIIEEKGLTPDYEVKISEEDAEKKKDPQLEKAI